MSWLSSRTTTLAILILLFLSLLLVTPTFIPIYWLGIVTLVFLWSSQSSAFNFLAGYAGQICFIAALYSGIGAYVTTVLLLKVGITPWVGLFVGAVISTTVATGIGALFFRFGLRDVYFALGTMAMLTIATAIFLNLPDETFGGAIGLSVIISEDKPSMMLFRSKLPYYYIALALAIITVLISVWVSHNRLGYWFKALRENSDAAEALGINVFAYKLLANGLAAFLLAIGGGFWALYVTYLEPYSAFLVENAGLIVIYMIVGGAGTVAGPVLGTAVLFPITEIVRAKFGQQYAGSHLVIVGLVLMGMLLYLPDGFMGALRSFKERFLLHVNQGNYSDWAKHYWNNLLDPPHKGYREIMAEAGIANVQENGGVVAPATTSTDSDEIILQANNLTRMFGGLRAVNNVSFAVKRGEIYGIIGPNGAGKTTTFNMLSGAMIPTEGKVTLSGEDVTGLFPHKIARRNLGRTFQITQIFPNLTVLETVMCGAFMRYPKRTDAERKAYQVLKYFSMLEIAHLQSANLTIADRKRLEIAKVMATEPEILLLDEVVAGLTEQEVDEIVALLKKINKERGITIVMIEHVMRAIMALCDRLLVLDFGTMIAEGLPKEITSNPKVIEAYLGKPMETNSYA